MIKDIRIVEWKSELGLPHWDIQVMYEGSDEWRPIKFMNLGEKPREVSREKSE